MSETTTAAGRRAGPRNDAAAPGPILCVVGARPNYMKMAPMLEAFRAIGEPTLLVHTGQHYDESMNDQNFRALGLPRPDVYLEVGSASHGRQTAEIMSRFEPVVEEYRPRMVVVVGDVNSTIACALVAVKMGVPVAHVEAGLRSFDRGMPEEINRVLTDQISDLLFTTEPSAAENLAREGIDASRVHFAGNVMIDSVLRNRERAVPARELIGDELAAGPYAVLTLHRPSNVDEPRILRRLLEVISEISERIPVVFPMHPRTRARIDAAGLEALVEGGRLITLPPVDYLQMIGLVRDATMVLTDSGGLQEETTAMGVPCLTIRENTERPITIDQGTNTLVGTDPAAIRAAAFQVLDSGGKAGRIPDKWDGRTAERIARIVSEWCAARPEARLS